MCLDLFLTEFSPANVWESRTITDFVNVFCFVFVFGQFLHVLIEFTNLNETIQLFAHFRTKTDKKI